MTPSGFRANCTAPSPNRIAGISAEVVPFQLRNDGRYDMWKPDWRITGDAAETMPARIAAAGRRMPNSTTVANHSSPVTTVAVWLLMLPCTDEYMTPPSAAIPAETAKMPSFTRSMETPEVLAAMSEERVAAMARPHA